MIQLFGPSQGVQRFFTYRGFFFGPVGPEIQERVRLASFQSDVDGMLESPGIYGENNVLHEKSNVELDYNPVYIDALRTPISGADNYPDALTIPTNNFGGQPDTSLAECGFPRVEAVSIFWLVRPYQRVSYYQLAIDDLPDGFKTIWYASGYADKVLSLTRYDMQPIKSFDSVYVTFDVKSTTYTMPGYPWLDFNLAAKCQLADLIGLSKGRTIASTSTDTVMAQWCTLRHTVEPVFSPSTVKRLIEAEASAMSLGDFPLKLVEYGDLAMQASEKVNANRVNMIAFIRDLRNPTSMIPKLTNLGKLKTYANDYLAVNYGILPTVSDIHSIFDACHRVAPYLDKNGYEVCTSASTQSSSEGNKSFLLEQHLKLAIDDEDELFQLLVEQAESMGVLPTFENVWDLIPYSFVIDWLINVGDLLRRVDTRMRLTRLNIRYVTMSYKQTTTKLVDWSNDFPYTGFIQFGRYNRWVSDQCPTPLTSLQSTFNGSEHWLEALALMIQRKKVKF